jgi:GTP-binding protein
MLISGITREGVPEVLRALVGIISEAPVSNKAKGAPPADEEAPPPTTGWSPLSN